MEKTKLEIYAEIQAMVQKEARDIATEVYEQLGTRTGVASVPLHTHNGVDTPKVPLTSIENLPVFSGSVGSVLNLTQSNGAFLANPNIKSGYVAFPVAVMGIDLPADFNGGKAPVGAMVAFESFAGNKYLFVNFAESGLWFGVELTIPI